MVIETPWSSGIRGVEALCLWTQPSAVVTGNTPIDTRTLVLVLLGGDAGLRRGEMIGLRWSDVDFRRRRITVRQSAWKDTMGVPKGGRERIVEMTGALHDALKRHQHLLSERVLCCDDGSPATPKMLRCWIAVAQLRGSLGAQSD